MLKYESLTPEVRAAMILEISESTARGMFYMSPRLSPRGEIEYHRLMLDAAANHDDGWLAQQLERGDRLKTMELRQGKPVKVPHNAAQTLSEGEFNRYYVRAVCRIAIEADPAAEVQIYRAKQVENPRTESQRKVGTRMSAAAILHDLRAASNADMNTALGVPAGPNSGLSVRFCPPSPSLAS